MVVLNLAPTTMDWTARGWTRRFCVGARARTDKGLAMTAARRGANLSVRVMTVRFMVVGIQTMAMSMGPVG